MSSEGRSKIVLVTVVIGAMLLGAAAGAGLLLWLSDGDGAPADQAADGAPDEGRSGGGPPPASVVVDLVRREALRQRFEVTGRLKEIRRAVIGSQVEGMLLEVPVGPGGQVEADKTVLGRVEDVFVRLELAEAEAELAEAAAELDQARRDLVYIESLAASSAAQPKEVDDARAAVATEQARYEAAVARRDRATENLGRVKITAPFDGTVIAKRAEIGERVEVGQPVIELVSRGLIDAVVDVPEQVINQVTLGDVVEVWIEAIGEAVPGEVFAVNPDGSGAARTFPVKMRLDDRGGRLKPGMSVRVKLPLEAEAMRLTVPRDAVQSGVAGSVVWVATDGQNGPPTGMPVPVTVLFGVGDRFAVAPGPGRLAGLLREQAQVVVQGAERIFFPGHALKVMNAGALAAPDGAPSTDQGAVADPDVDRTAVTG